MWKSPALGLIGIGSFLATAIVGVTLIGVWLDGRLGTRPILTLVFLTLGLVTGFYGAYMQLRDLMVRTRRGDDEET